MIWSKSKAGDDCPGCGVKLIDEPWKDNLNKNSAAYKMNTVRWLVHEDTLHTICKRKPIGKKK